MSLLLSVPLTGLDKHTGLLRYRLNYVRKKFMIQATEVICQGQTLQLILSQHWRCRICFTTMTSGPNVVFLFTAYYEQ